MQGMGQSGEKSDVKPEAETEAEVAEVGIEV
jgi:hypothetical protein